MKEWYLFSLRIIQRIEFCLNKKKIKHEGGSMCRGVCMRSKTLPDYLHHRNGFSCAHKIVCMDIYIYDLIYMNGLMPSYMGWKAKNNKKLEQKFEQKENKTHHIRSILQTRIERILYKVKCGSVFVRLLPVYFVFSVFVFVFILFFHTSLHFLSSILVMIVLLAVVECKEYHCIYYVFILFFIIYLIEFWMLLNG